jgi:hypothetical protein
MSNKILTELNDLNGNQSNSGEFRANIVCTNPKLKKRSSTQAATIEKARDLIDNVEEVVEGGDVSFFYFVVVESFFLGCEAYVMALMIRLSRFSHESNLSPSPNYSHAGGKQETPQPLPFRIRRVRHSQ